jgi:hypothetical protein
MQQVFISFMRNLFKFGLYFLLKIVEVYTALCVLIAILRCGTILLGVHCIYMK